MDKRKERIAGEYGMELFANYRPEPINDEDVRALRQGDLNKCWAYFARHIRKTVESAVKQYFAYRYQSPTRERIELAWSEMIFKLHEYLTRYPQLIAAEADSVGMLSRFIHMRVPRDTKRFCKSYFDNKRPAVSIRTENDFNSELQESNYLQDNFSYRDTNIPDRHLANNFDKLDSELFETSEKVACRYLILKQKQATIAEEYGLSQRTVRRHVDRHRDDRDLLEKANRALGLKLKEYPRSRKRVRSKQNA